MKYTREGGFRSKLLARLTNGRHGLGRWTEAELDDIRRRVHERYEHLWEEDDCE